MTSASAPGRLDVMGGIADYSGSLVLQTPLKEETRCEVSRRDDRIVRIQSANRAEVVSLDLARLMRGGDLDTYAAAKAYFTSRPGEHWASYVVGVLLVLSREERIFPKSGLTISIESDVPEGKGVGSSAALEVAAMRACLEYLRRVFRPERIAEMCQIAENRVVGAPCGIMDQMTASCGRRGMLMKLLCQPAELQGFAPLPDGVSVWGIDSGVRHSVAGSGYGSVRTGAAMGFRIIEQAEGGPDDRFGGYLANVGPDALREKFEKWLPDHMKGRDFLREFGGVSDTAVEIDPGTSYPVKAPTMHPIHEHDRVSRFVSILEQEPTKKNLAMLGELMYLSHAGYSACGLGSPGTDRLVQMVREVGYKQGLFGARITGGGGGGTVAVLGRAEAKHRIHEIADQYERETGLQTQIF
ncbi:MAG: galactokinase [Rhodothermia bacterium]